MNPDAPPFIPTFARGSLRRWVYSRATLKDIEPAVVERICCSCLTDFQSTYRVPVDFAALLSLPFALEWLNVNHVVSLVRENRPSVRSDVPRDAHRLAPIAATGGGRSSCAQCEEGPEACSIVGEVVAAAVRRAASSGVGAVLLQAGDVVWGLLQIALVFEARQSSMRLRALAQKHPGVLDRVKQFLCGEGYHLPLPSITAHEEWGVLNAMLKFDWIRDNRTKIYTEISRRWKKRHTQFEQFVYFFEYRDDRPLHPVKNMLTRSTKPVLVSVLSGDVLAVVLLARLGFFVPPDYYWDIFPFFAESLIKNNETGNQMYILMRHLCLHLAERQRVLHGAVYNPVLPPKKLFSIEVIKTDEQKC